MSDETLLIEVTTERCPYCFNGMPYVARGNSTTVTECNTLYYNPSGQCRKCDGKGLRRIAKVNS